MNRYNKLANTLKPILEQEQYEILCDALINMKQLCNDVIQNELCCLWNTNMVRGNFYVANDTKLSDGKSVSEHIDALSTNPDKHLLRRILEFELMLEHVETCMSNYIPSINNIIGIDNKTSILVLVLLFGWIWYDMCTWMKLSCKDESLNMKLLDIIKRDNGMNINIVHRFHGFVKAVDSLCCGNKCKECHINKDNININNDEYDLAQSIDSNSCVFVQLKTKELSNLKLPPLINVIYKSYSNNENNSIACALWHIAAAKYLVNPDDLGLLSENISKQEYVTADTISKNKYSMIVAISRSVTTNISSNLLNDKSRLEYVVVQSKYMHTSQDSIIDYKTPQSYILYSYLARDKYNIVAIAYNIDELITKINEYSGTVNMREAHNTIDGSNVDTMFTIKQQLLYLILVINVLIIIVCVIKYNTLSINTSTLIKYKPNQ